MLVPNPLLKHSPLQPYPLFLHEYLDSHMNTERGYRLGWDTFHSFLIYQNDSFYYAITYQAAQNN